MLVILLLLVIVVLAAALLVLWHNHMVNQAAWHAFTRDLASKAAVEVAALKQWVAEHVHLHTAPSTPPAPSAAKK